MNARPIFHLSFHLPRTTLCLRGALVAFLSLAAACSPPPPRSYDFFLGDSIARDGALARCSQQPEAALRDIECANASRAATAIQLSEERSRRELLERESEQKLEALRQQFAAHQQAAREAEAAAIAAARAAYEAQWDESRTAPLSEGAAATSGSKEATAAPVEPASQRAQAPSIAQEAGG